MHKFLELMILDTIFIEIIDGEDVNRSLHIFGKINIIGEAIRPENIYNYFQAISVFQELVFALFTPVHQQHRHDTYQFWHSSSQLVIIQILRNKSSDKERYYLSVR